MFIIALVGFSVLAIGRASNSMSSRVAWLGASGYRCRASGLSGVSEFGTLHVQVIPRCNGSNCGTQNCFRDSSEFHQINIFWVQGDIEKVAQKSPAHR
jgi:hypothetical protein